MVYEDFLMHPEAMEFIRTALAEWGWQIAEGGVLEFGSRDVNGSPRSLFQAPFKNYVGVDIEDGPGVDIVGDAATVHITGVPFDVVICAEVAEHTPDWQKIIRNAYGHLRYGGLFIFTAACDPRPPHSAVDGHDMKPSEYVNGLKWDHPDSNPVGDMMQVAEIHGPNSWGRPGPPVEYYRNIDPHELNATLLELFHDSDVRVLPRGDLQATAVK